MNASEPSGRGFDRAEKIANAVLYEGYILYPYRPSAVKNQQRWTFGGIYPQGYSQAQGEADAWYMQTECLVLGASNKAIRLDMKVRFLHLLQREVGKFNEPLQKLPETAKLNFRIVQALTVGDKVFYTWQEAVERTVNLTDLVLEDLVVQPHLRNFNFPSSHVVEPLRHPNGQIIGVIIRLQQAIAGAIEVRAEPVRERATHAWRDQVFKVTIKIMNLTPFQEVEQPIRDAALMRSFASTHAILSVLDGEFVSLLDPPAPYRAVAMACHNVGTYPVLVGEEGTCNLMLSSPIILYDYPQIAPESAGDLFDSTEIDEILTLRILTMTDEEKQEMRQVDERARKLLDRTEALPFEQLMKLHGTIRNLRPLEGRP